jgi:hypothetical protein
MGKKKVNEVKEVDSDSGDDIEEVIEEVKEAPKINKKTGKPYLSDEEKLKIRRENMRKAIEAKQQKNDITKSLKEKKKELTKVELEQKKKELEELEQRLEEKKQEEARLLSSRRTKPKAQPTKPKKVVEVEDYDDEEDDPEEEKIIVKRKKNKSLPIVNEEDYTQLIKQSAVEQLQKRLENERIRMSLLSIAPNYRF